MPKRFLLPALLIALSVSAFAQGPAEPTGPTKSSAKKAAALPPSEVTDEGLEKSRASMDGRFAARLSGIKNSADGRSAFLARVEKKRFDFERHALEERKAFYVYLRSVSMNEREKALKEFDEKEERNRTKFDKEMLGEEKNWFEEEIDKNWKSSSLLAETPAARPAPVAAPAAAIKPKPVAKKPVKKAKAVAKKRKSRIKEEPQEQAVEPEPAAAPEGSPMPQQGGAGDPSTTN